MIMLSAATNTSNDTQPVRSVASPLNGCQSAAPCNVSVGSAIIITLSNTMKLATFDPVAMTAVTGVGAPWYASGAQRWNGTTATLKPRPAIVKTSPSIKV